MNWAFKEGKLLEDYGTWHHQSRGKFIRHHQFRSFFFVCPLSLLIANDENFFHLCSYSIYINVYAWFPSPLLLIIIVYANKRHRFLCLTLQLETINLSVPMNLLFYYSLLLACLAWKVFCWIGSCDLWILI